LTAVAPAVRFSALAILVTPTFFFASPFLGYGRFGPKVTMDGVSRFDRADSFDGRRVHLADIDGSGTADIIYVAAGEIRLFFSQSGNALGPPHLLDHFPSVDSASSAQVLDLLGNGTACLVWSSPLTGNARSPMRNIDLMGGEKPHLRCRQQSRRRDPYSIRAFDEILRCRQAGRHPVDHAAAISGACG
jgi:hypothetical protein